MGEQKQEPASGEAGEEGRAGRGPLTASWRMGGRFGHSQQEGELSR